MVRAIDLLRPKRIATSLTQHMSNGGINLLNGTPSNAVRPGRVKAKGRARMNTNSNNTEISGTEPERGSGIIGGTDDEDHMLCYAML